MSAHNDQKTLRSLHNSIRHSSTMLVSYVEETLYGKIYRMPGLVPQLRSAIGTGREAIQKLKGRNFSPLVISVQAFDLMAEIERATKEWSKEKTTEARIAKATGEFCVLSTGSLPMVAHYELILNKWVVDINSLFNPAPKYYIAAACPQCDRKLVSVWSNDAREYVTAPALQIVKEGGKVTCKCYGCGTIWPETHLELLAKAIGD